MAHISIEIKPIMIPDYVTLKRVPGKHQDGIYPATPIRIEDLPLDVLKELLDDFVSSCIAKNKGEMF